MTSVEAAPRKTKRGLLDAVLMAALMYAVYARTPIGAAVETGINVARGQKERPSWLATFKGRETAVAMPLDPTTGVNVGAAALSAPPAVMAAATKYHVDVEALAALLSVQGQCSVDPKQPCDLATPARISTLLQNIRSERIDVDTAARALAAGQRALGDTPLAIEAMYVGAPSVKLAVSQAERSGLTHVDASDVEAHAEFFTPSIRRGTLQTALRVLSVHRLRTLAWPADPALRITSPFGPRVHPVTGKQSLHNGTDIGAATGTLLLAAARATVKRQSEDSVSGRYVVLDLGLGLQTTYCHLSEPRVIAGEHLARLQAVGLSGATGRVTGPHLHYILRVQDTPVDAELYGEAPHRVFALDAPSAPAPTSE